MTQTEWIRLNSDAIAPSVHPIDARWTTEAPSPYDVPSHVRSSYDPSTGKMIIAFRYFEPEKVIPLDLGNYIRAMVGRDTHRVWSIEFDVHSFNRDKNRMEEVTRFSIASASGISNSAIAARAISEKSAPLFREAIADAA